METLSRRNYFTLRTMVSKVCFELQESRRNNDRKRTICRPTTIYRWVMIYAPEIDKRIRKYLKSTNDSWRVDETYIKVKGKWKYLYRATD